MEDILKNIIFNSLDIKSLGSSLLVCKYWNNIIKKTTPSNKLIHSEIMLDTTHYAFSYCQSPNEYNKNNVDEDDIIEYNYIYDIINKKLYLNYFNKEYFTFTEKLGVIKVSKSLNLPEVLQLYGITDKFPNIKIKNIINIFNRIIILVHCDCGQSIIHLSDDISLFYVDNENYMNNDYIYHIMRKKLCAAYSDILSYRTKKNINIVYSFNDAKYSYKMYNGWSKIFSYTIDEIKRGFNTCEITDNYVMYKNGYSLVCGDLINLSFIEYNLEHLNISVNTKFTLYKSGEIFMINDNCVYKLFNNSIEKMESPILISS